MKIFIIKIGSLEESLDPCNKTLKGLVTHVSPLGWRTHRTASGVDTSKLTFMLADDNAFVKAVAYGDKFKNSIMKGRTLALRNFVFKDSCVKVISQTQVFRYVLHIFMKIE